MAEIAKINGTVAEFLALLREMRGISPITEKMHSLLCALQQKPHLSGNAQKVIYIYLSLLEDGNTRMPLDAQQLYAKWEQKWKSEWEKSLHPTPPAMTEDEAKAKWEAKWKAGWETSLPPTPPVMTEAEAKTKWEAQWKLEWETAYRRKLRTSFEKQIGGYQRISDFEKAMLKIDPYYEDYKANKAPPLTPQAPALYETLKVYVSFVENAIFNNQQQSKER